MARYKLREAAVIGDRRYEAGEEVEYDGVPGPHMEPVDPAAKQAAEAAAKGEVPARDPGMVAHPEERTTPGRSEPRVEPEKKEPEPPREPRHPTGGSRGSV
jgi:hypothetical protein